MTDILVSKLETEVEDNSIVHKGHILINDRFITCEYRDNHDEFEVRFSKDGMELTYKRSLTNRDIGDLIKEAANYFWGEK